MMYSNILTSFLLLPSLAQLAFSAATKRAVACNNSPDLCDRSYNNVTHLGAHNSPFLRDLSTGNSASGNQFYNSTVQLSAGVRLLTAQVHNSNSTWRLCHTSCSLLDAGLLSDWLSGIKTWLDANPNEVVTVLLVNSDDATASELGSAYSTAGITSYAYTPSSSTPPSEWPTLQTLISKGTRLLNFVEALDDNTAAPYLMDEFTYIFENNYDNTSPSEFSCTANRPSTLENSTTTALRENLMPFMNHFLYTTENLLGSVIESPNATYIATTNALSGGVGNLGDAAAQCANTYGQAPTFLLVDFFNVGPAISTADKLNGVTGAVGRANVSTADSAPSSSSSTRDEVSVFALVAALSVTVAMSF